MIYLDNIIFSLQKAGGISVVWKNLIDNLPKTNALYFIEYPNAYQNIFRQKISISSERIIRSKKFSPIFSQLKSPIIKTANRFIFHSSYYRTCDNPKAINVTTVHDFIYEQGKPTLKQKLRIYLNYRAIHKSDAVVCISENTKRDLFKFLPDINPKKVHVIYNGVSEDYFPLNQSSFPEYEEYILFVGGRQSYKNFDFVVKSISATNYKLLVCGSPLNESEIELVNKYLPNRYHQINFPSNEELNKIYNSVFALAYPSSYEGFGLPVLEAQRAGCPVIALNASSIPEIIGENGLLMPELTTSSFESLIADLENTDKRQTIIAAGIENTKNFSWKKMADEYLALYNKLLRP